MAAAADSAEMSAQGQGQASPRKRRRRAPTTGAADDCFTCRDRGVACDRRRPYCTQCLDIKVTCSGYKTQLTWGVGVASRGKLRGLSLPVAKSKPAVGAGEKPASRKASSASKRTPKTPASATSVPSSIQSRTSSQPVSTPPTSASMSYSFVGIDSNAPAQSAPPYQTNFEWPPQQPKFASSDVRTQPVGHGMQPGNAPTQIHRPLKRQSLHLDTSDIPAYNQTSSHPMSAQPSLGHQYAPRPYDSPVSPHQLPYEPIHSQHVRYGSFSGHQNRPTMHIHQMPNSNPNSAPLNSPNSWPSNYPSPSSVSDSGSHINSPDGMYLGSSYSDASIGMAADQLLAMQQPHSYMSQNALTFGAIDAIHEVDDEIDEEIKREDIERSSYEHGLLRLNQTFSNHERVGNTPELQYLINYYLEVLTPVILAFDGPGNPWREHILSLARSNEGLQHAIAALSASNLRMRREHKNDKPRLPPTGDSVHDVSVRKSTEAHERLNDEIEPPELSVPGAPSARESFHKTNSIKFLNKQLADPSRRSDDSIVAILLIICLYHMCETGVARFRTQFAGVKRIMSLRAQRQAPSKEINWMVTYFKWFDAMAATVNDRECQFPEESTIMPLPDDDWGLENLAGCDSRLFTIVSKLGRLNVLNQGRNTTSNDGNLPTPFFSSPMAGPQAPHMHPDLVFDVSGWAQMSPAASTAGTSLGDPRSQFWTEWAQVRQDLINWSFDPSYLPNAIRSAANSSASKRQDASSRPHAHFADMSIADISNVSESFRHAALLYTERLAYPNLPSATPQFQNIVQTALHYIKLVKSDVCLLWPLFIVGTESIREEDRSVVRARAWDIQKDSGFYNNIKTLELLEVIWDRTDKEGRGGNVGGNRAGWDELPHGTEAFRWRKEMQTSEGEYIVI